MALSLLEFLAADHNHPPDDDARHHRQLAPLHGGSCDPDHTALFEQLRQGSEDALHHLYQHYYKRLLQFAFHISGTRDSAEDAVHTVFLTLWTSRERLTLKGSVSAYLYRAVRNTILKSAAHTRVVRSAEVTDALDAPYGMSTPLQPVDLALEAADDLRVAIVVIQRLPERQRTAVILRWHGEMTTAAIADVMGITRQGVEKLLHAALTKLRAALLAPPQS